jgi:adenine-specific DNA-methyltransferase
MGIFRVASVLQALRVASMLQKLLYIGNVKASDIILDFFSGSATTAHAVMKLNAEDG